MSRLHTALLATLVLFLSANAQDNTATFPNPLEPTSPEARLQALEKRQALRAASPVKNVPLRSVGPTIMSGRVSDLDVSPTDPTHFYVAYASGGLWKTTSNGSDFKPLFDGQASMTIGDMAVDWQNGETIWVGTGENNSSRSSYAGTGLYRSADGGETWTYHGLSDSQHIGRILLHPTDPNTIWVAALGRLYSPNQERGVYKSTDGGETWNKTLFTDDNTGAIDLVADPSNPDILYAAMWHRARRAWDFVEGGSTSGIYKSSDGGASWTLISEEGSGFPNGEGIGRIGLAVYAGNPQIVYALVDNHDPRPPKDEEEEGLTRTALRTMDAAAFLALEPDEVETFLRDNDFPDKYTAASVRRQVEKGEIKPIALVEYLEDANSDLFDTEVTGAEVYRSDDGGATWRRTHADYIDDLYNTYGYYFGEIRLAGDTPDRLYILGVPLLRSTDGGKTFEDIDRENVHSDHQAMWVNPDRPGHLINGNDGGLNMSYDDGETWFKLNTPAVGQFYTVAVDMAEPYNVYGGLQDNGVWRGPSTYEFSRRWHDSGRYPYESLLGGDGMQVQVDTRTNEVIYTGYQFGHYTRIDRATGKRTRVRPTHELGDRPLRFNWQTPIHLSIHNQDILYMGSNKLHRSLNRGEEFQDISGDLTQGGRPGNVPYGTLTSVHESPLRFGLLYTGSDDGVVHVSKDGGVTWTRISNDLPQDLWVSRVRASSHAEGRVYVTLNGYRWDHFEPYLYRSDDYGATWTQLGTDLPTEALNVVAEDPVNPDLLYVGSDHTLYVSLDGGVTFHGMANGMPDAPVHDVVIQSRENELVVGTHGRSIYIADIGPVQQLTDSLRTLPVYVFALESVRHNERWGERRGARGDVIEPEIGMVFYQQQAGAAVVRVKAGSGEFLHESSIQADSGLNYFTYDATVDPALIEAYDQKMERANRRKADSMAPVAGDAAKGSDKRYLKPGSYTIQVATAGTTVETQLEIEEQ